MRPARHAVPFAALITVLALAGTPPPAAAQQRPPSEEMIERGHRMLAQLKADLVEFYYDSTFHGMNLEARYRAADSSIAQAPTVSHLMGAIAQFLLDLNDTHTSFIPPSLAVKVEYGWAWDMIGDSCYVTAVDRHSDAASKGLAVGDRIVGIDGIAPTRRSRVAIGYVYYRLRPRPGMHLLIEKPDGSRRELDIQSRVTQGLRVTDVNDPTERHFMIEEFLRNSVPLHRVVELGDSVLVWSMLEFVPDDEYDIDLVMDQARRRRALILDLRGNPGGEEEQERHVIGSFFDHDVLIGTWKRRHETIQMRARRVGREPFRGMLIVLMNGSSASASEIFARVMQLEERAIIVGDRSAGATMRSMGHFHEVGGTERSLVYGASITDADIVMTDGTRLENHGVIPTEFVVPTGADLAAKRDPQMARALALAGVTMTPEQAGHIYDHARRP